MRTTDEKIKLRNHWFKIILISLFSMVLMFKIAVTKFTFHFSDMLAFILAIFAIGICSMFYVKINEALQAFTAAGKALLPVTNKNNQNVAEDTEETIESEITLNESDREEMERQLLTLEEQVKRMKQVQKEITNRLIDEDLHEDDKRDYIDYLLQKEKEIMLAKQEVVRITTLLEPEDILVEEEEYEYGGHHPEDSQDEHSVQTATAKDVVQILGKEFVLHASLEQFNHKMREIQHSITIETANHLKEEGLIDQYFNVTRKGLKEFRRAAKKFSYEDGVKFLSKVVQRGNR